MHFQHPSILLLLWILPGVAALLVVAQKRRLAAASRFLNQPMLARLTPEMRGPRPWTKGALTLVGMALLIVAAAQPQYGIFYEKVKQQHGVDCFVLLDVSRSMLAEDVVPNRLARAKSDIRDLLKKLGGDRVGLIVFAGKPVLKVPLTTDAGFFDMVLDDIDTRSAPRGGTLIGDAIRKALDSLPPRGDHDQMLVLLTDGEDQDSYPLDAAKLAAERGVKIFTVGLGDSNEGARIPVRNTAGKLEFVKEEGKEHWSKTDQSVLRQIADVTGGAHVAAGTRTYDPRPDLRRPARLADTRRGAAGSQSPAVQRSVSGVFGTGARAADDRPSAARLLRRGATERGSDDRHAVGSRVCLVFRPWVRRQPRQPSAAVRPRKLTKAFRRSAAATSRRPPRRLAPRPRRCPTSRESRLIVAALSPVRKENDKAIEQFQVAAASQNRPLAAAAHYNLGCLALAKAKAKLGEKPEEAKPEVRKESLDAMEQAVGHWRDCLTVDPDHADARYNVEAIRLWKKHIQDVWKKRDLQKRRQDMNLLQFLQWIEKEQRDLRAKNRPLASEQPSPKHREAMRAVENTQRELADEIAPLKEKIHAALSTPPGAAASGGTASQPATPQPLSPEAEKAQSLLNGLADEACSAMGTAADALATQKPLEASKPQADAIEKIDSIFMVVSPFVELVKKGIAIEEGLIAQSKNAVNGTSDDNHKESNNKKSEKAQKVANSGNSEADWPDAAWNQRLISNYGRVLAAKAKRELEQLAKMPAASPEAQKASPEAQKTQPSAKASPNANALPIEKALPTEKGGQQPNAQDQQKEMKRALQAGVDLAPKVLKASNEAASHLDAAKPASALPPQEETLKLLKEMLPKQDQKKNDQDKDKQDQNQKDQDKKKQDKKDQNKKDSDKKDSKDKDEQKKKDQDKKDQNKKDSDKQNQEKKPKADKQEQDKEQLQKQDPSKQQAEAAMRQVRQRQQDRREKEKILLEKRYQADRVDKDW